MGSAGARAPTHAQPRRPSPPAARGRHPGPRPVACHAPPARHAWPHQSAPHRGVGAAQETHPEVTSTCRQSMVRKWMLRAPCPTPAGQLRPPSVHMLAQHQQVLLEEALLTRTCCTSRTLTTEGVLPHMTSMPRAVHRAWFRGEGARGGPAFQRSSLPQYFSS